jgi:hypothetical protein
MGSGSFPMALRTDSVYRGSSISRFTLESVVLALFDGFFVFFILIRRDRSQSLFSIAHLGDVQWSKVAILSVRPLLDQR